MRFATFEPLFASRIVPDRHRLVSLALVVLLHALLFALLLLGLTSPEVPLEKPLAPITIDLVAEPEAVPDRSRAAEAPRASPEAKQAEPGPDTTVAPPVAPKSSIWSEVIPMTREQLATTDRALQSLPRPMQQPGTSGESRMASTGRTDDSEGPGTGPNGETLYNARWQREPTDAELATYLPARRATGWGVIACRTVPDNRVEDCVEIAQSPGSGLAGAIRRAAWQFRVLPPRIGGRPMVGEWVRIRIDYEVKEAKRPAASTGLP